jgi:hypothetical protein
MTRSNWSLAIVAFAAGALVAGAFLVPSGAAATQGQPVIAGQGNTATDSTIVENSKPAGIGMIVTGEDIALAGHADADGGTGVFGDSSFATGIGVEGDVTGSGSGVFGHATGAGVGVNGQSASGTGIYAQSSNGRALDVVGKARFSRSGVVTIAAGASSRTVHLAGVTRASMVLATAQQATAVFVQAAVPVAGTFSIQLTGPAPGGGLKVAYFVLN